MRSPRIKLPNEPAVYHCISRLTDGLAPFKEPDLDSLQKLLSITVEFCGVDLITHGLMNNHFHLLVRTPGDEPPDDQELLRRVRVLYGEKSSLTQSLQEDIDNKGRISDEVRRRLHRRMGDVSMFMKELKQRFTRWYNKSYNRRGTLWAERFKSVLVEDQPESVLRVASYIDLNPVRAGIIADPGEYPYCGYSQALGTEGRPREVLARYLPGQSWEEKVEHYREYLFCRSGFSGHSDKKALSGEQIRELLGKEGKVALPLLMRLRVRYMTEGAVLGSREFVEKMFGKFRPHFGSRRKEGAREMKGADWGGLRVLRALRKKMFSDF